MPEDRELDKWDYIYYALWAGAALGFLMWGLGLLGEYLGWWNHVGEALMLVGRWAGFGLTAVAVLVGASRSQVEQTMTAVEETKGAVHETKDAVHETKDAVETNGSKLDDQTRILRQIRDRF